MGRRVDANAGAASCRELGSGCRANIEGYGCRWNRQDPLRKGLGTKATGLGYPELGRELARYHRMFHY